MSEAPEMPEVIERAPANAPQDDAPAPEAVQNAPEPADEPQDAPEAPQPEERAQKSPVSQLKGRIGHLTKTLHAKDAELEAERAEKAKLDAQIKAYQAMIEANGAEHPAGSPQERRDAPQNFDEAVNARAAEIAAKKAFDDACNAVYNTGHQKHGQDFVEAIDNLNAAGLTQQSLVEAALATDAAPEVLFHLGQDLDEAARIAQLPPIRMAAELTKLASRLTAPAPKPPVSQAPAPITPIGGSASPSLDIYDAELSDEEYYARRMKQGAPFVRAPRKGA